MFVLFVKYLPKCDNEDNEELVNEESALVSDVFNWSWELEIFVSSSFPKVAALSIYLITCDILVSIIVYWASINYFSYSAFLNDFLLLKFWNCKRFLIFYISNFVILSLMTILFKY